MEQLLIISDLNHPKLIPDDHKFLETIKNSGRDYKILPWENIPSFEKQFANFSKALIRTTWNYTLNFDTFLNNLEFLASKLELVNPISTIKENYHKSYLLNLNYEGMKLIPGEIIQNFSGLSHSKIQKLEKSWDTQDFVIKPVVGGSGRDTFKFNKSDELTFPTLHNREVFLQKFTPEIKNFGEISVMIFGGKFSHAVRKFQDVSKEEFRIQQEHGGNCEAYIPSETELAKIDKFLTANKVDLPYARVDYCLETNSNELLLMELELIEPELFFRFSQEGEAKLLKSIFS